MLLTPPLTPQTTAEAQGSSTAVRPIRYQRRSPRLQAQADADVSPDFILPPPVEPVPLVLPEPSLPYESDIKTNAPIASGYDSGPQGYKGEWAWREGMSMEERDMREEWLAGGRGRSGLRIVIVTGKSVGHLRSRLMNRELPALYQRRLTHARTSTRASTEGGSSMYAFGPRYGHVDI